MKRILTFLFILLAIAPVLANNTGEERFIWNEANSLMSSAQNKTDFINAANSYNKLLQRGIRNEPLLYNLGTALLMAGHYDHAADFLTRAERYSGTNWEIKRNLQLTYAKGDSSIVQPLPWYRFPLFWHYMLPLSTRIVIATCAYTLFWAALALARLRIRALSRTVAVISLLTLIIFGSSAATSIHQENSAPSLRIDQLPPATEDLPE